MIKYEILLNQYNIDNATQWAQQLGSLDSNKANAILRQLIPEHFCSDGASKLHTKLSEDYPEFLQMIQHTNAFFSSFPKSGIPAQSKSIAQCVDPSMNAGIGIAKDTHSQILVHPKLSETINFLKPSNVDDQEWSKLTQALYKYNNGLGANWYRSLSKQRYLNDIKKPELQNQAQNSLKISPIPVFGGTSGLSSIFDMFGGAGTPVIFPRTYWGNMNLMADQKGLLKTPSDYIDINGNIQLDVLDQTLTKLKQDSFKKVCIYLNFPHNPSSTVLTESQAQALASLLQSHAKEDFQIINVCDEPYFPFVRGDQAIQSPLSSYLQPNQNRNMLTLATINGTKRDGMYGFRHADLVLLLPNGLTVDIIDEIENNLFAGYFRGCFSFSNAINQYLLARSLSSDPLIPLKSADAIALDPDYIDKERQLVSYMSDTVNRSILKLDKIPYLTRVKQTQDASGGFFISYQLNQQFKDLNITPMDVHKTALTHGLGVIAAGEYIRINALIEESVLPDFCFRLVQTLKDLLEQAN
ncbi:MAG: aminotransferase class I/II-fold pyridoxal phosphate-dependent enzyme [Candidatus Cloacimonetes bacterium]|nr:aminotransferase class I/II-fold pyridoxal phosphate-dependent enzyme [Candidatus Cloacimonadota bacterium]